ncbi:hypothetical protein FRC12_017489 [Ceratobasidium sp. 428]|nr:hypothetical protein FRC12_017489 [Ceratobasidium sp. 428]
MSRLDFKIGIDLLDKTKPHVLEIQAADLAILNEEDVDFILNYLPPVSMARVDTSSYKPFLGIDIFYDQEASLNGFVLVFESRALAVRVPATIAKTSRKRHQEEVAATTKVPSAPDSKLKGNSRAKMINPHLSSLECLRKLLRSDLVGFGMAQISLTLWHYLRERVSGVNLSTATSEKIPPPMRTLPETKSKDEPQSNTGTQNDQQSDGLGKKGGKGGSHKKKGHQGGSTNNLKGPQQNKSSENPKDKDEANAESPVVLPDDEELNWDRKIISPGQVVKKIFPETSVMDIDSAFIGSDFPLDLAGRIAEAATRAWVSSMVAKELNDEVQNAPVIQPSRLRDKELTFFADSMVTKWKVLGEKSPLRPLQMDQFEDEDGLLKSTKYETRLRAGNVARQYITYTEDGVEKRIYIRRPGDRNKMQHTFLTENEEEKQEQPARQQSDGDGWKSVPGRGRGSHRQRRGQVREFGEETSELPPPGASSTGPAPKPGFKLPKDIEASVYGREEATQSEKQRDMFTLRLLEGRGSLHGPKYEDCAFIRRVWFPTRAQINVGEVRKQKKLKPTRGKHDWIDDDWDDDTDEEEQARIKVLTLEEGDEDKDDETEDEYIGREDPERGVSLPEDIELNSSQRGVVGRVVALNPRGRTRATLVHGPPGTGKTSTIAAAVVILAELGEPVWIVAQSNDGIRNVAEKLQKVGFDNFVLLVSQDYYSYWEERYQGLKQHFFPTPWLTDRKKAGHCRNRLYGAKAILCTLATLSSSILDICGAFVKRPLQHLIVDEASQLDMTSEFMHLFYKHRSALKSVCWFGDPKQLPPFGSSEGLEINDIFKVEHLSSSSKLLDTSYRLPVPLAKYISTAVYQGELKEHAKNPDIKPREKSIVFVDVAKGQEEPAGNEGKSWKNTAEAEVVIQLVQTYYEKPIKQDWEKEEKMPEYAIITPYEGQRSHVESELKKLDSKKQVYNVDSFQGNEADFIIITIAKTGSPGFLSSINRLNVLLTRCKRGLVVVTQKSFVQRSGGLLQGLWFSLEPHNPWVSAEDVVGGYVDLPGSPAPNTRPPPPEVTPSAPTSRTSLPPRPGGLPPSSGATSQPSMARIVQQGMRPPATTPAAPPIKGVWGQAQGLDRVKNPWGRPK